ncbi:MAG: 50S ribosomal protein L9 [Puniceicoccales bacterium]|jgi:large subunit ribosomal protein L9|nr:50S ribosomal protein L9 [Puniceicoccales bacterium]
MATIQVLLLKPVKHLGCEGEIVSVKAGYARNYLLPKSLVIPLNRSNQRQVEALQKARTVREAKELESAKTLSERIRAIPLTIAVKTGEEGKLFGSVSSLDLWKRFREEGVELDKSFIRLPHPIKTLGRHVFQMRLHKEIILDLSVEVVSENPIG